MCTSKITERHKKKEKQTIYASCLQQNEIKWIPIIYFTWNNNAQRGRKFYDLYLMEIKTLRLISIISKVLCFQLNFDFSHIFCNQFYDDICFFLWLSFLFEMDFWCIAMFFVREIYSKHGHIKRLNILLLLPT